MIEQSHKRTTRNETLDAGRARMRVNMTELYAQREWAGRLGCTREELRAAVAAVGNVVSDIANYLKSHK